MGFFKDKMLRDESRGWRNDSDDRVCGKCTEDRFLAQHVEAHADATHCDFCDTESGNGTLIAAPVQVFLGLVSDAINFFWTDPANELPYESAEGGFIGKSYDTEDLLLHLGIGWGESLTCDVVHSLTNNHWCKRHYFTLDSINRLVFGWEGFERVAKREGPVAALLPPKTKPEWKHPDEVSPWEMLDQIAACVHDCDLFIKWPVGTVLHRARAHDPTVTLKKASELGPPSAEQAIWPNRMSGAGNPAFYGACEQKTAIVETFDSTDPKLPIITTARFRTVRPLNILDLCDFPELPSYFDLDRVHIRHAMLFLSKFAAAVSQPTKKDSVKHIEYVPTQLFAGFVQRYFTTTTDEPVHGILYPSSRIRGGRCCVLFCDQLACGVVPTEPWRREEQWLELDETSIQRRSHADCTSDCDEAIKTLRRA